MQGVRAMRFGVQLSQATSPAKWREVARKVEDLGYSTLFMPDHLDGQWSPLVALTVAAEATTTLRVGTLVLDNDYRHPLLVAREAATLDLLSGGRLELGIGAGWMTTDYEQSGIPLDPPAVRVERLGEAVEILRRSFSGEPDEPVSFEGHHYRLDGASAFPAPAGRPRLLIGGGGRRVLTLAARTADIVGVNPNLRAGVVGPEAIASAVPAAYDERLRWVREAAGDRMAEIELQALTFVVQVVDNGREVLEQLAVAFGTTPEEAGDSPVGLVGSVGQIAETLLRRRDRWGFTYWVVHEAEIDAFAPVVAQVAS